MGKVFRATDRLTGQTVALKQVTKLDQLQISTTLSGDQSEGTMRLALAREFQTLASLRHPHIISVLDYGFDDNGNPFFAMSYLAKAQTFLEAGKPLDTEGKLTLVGQLIQALTYLHRREIMHRDLKPSNILVADGAVKVLDFGLSVSSQEKAGASGGTLLYLAPEVWEQQPYSTASDMFAVGVLTYQLFTPNHIHPFAPLDHALLIRVVEEDPDWSQLNCGDEIISFIAQLLQKDPQKRLRAADVLRELSLLLGRQLPETAAIRESYLQASAFVGREIEHQHLTDLLQQSAAGKGQGVLIGGESGVGKTRLINEMRIQALVDGFVVLQGQGVQGGGLPYQLWRDPIRRMCLMTDLTPLVASVLHPLVPDLTDLLDREIAEAPELDGNLAQQRLFNVITDLLHQHTRPVLLVLEDLQWAKESLAILTWLMRNIEGNNLLVVGTYRLEERPSLPTQFPNMIHIPLNRLTDSDVRKLCIHMLGKTGITDKLINFLQLQSEGNTFFLVEVVRELAEQAGRLDTIGQIVLPKTVFPSGITTILDRRLDMLNETTKPLLKLAAVAGRQIDLALMRQLTNAKHETVEEWLQIVTEVGLLTVDRGHWQFAHDKLREGILAQLDSATAQNCHRQIAEALEIVYPGAASRAAELVRHWGKVGDTQKEKSYALQAGHYAKEQRAYRESITYLKRAMQLIANHETEQCYQILLAQEGIYDLLGEREEQQAILIQLKRVAEKISVFTQGTVALRQSKYAYVVSNYDLAITEGQNVLNFGQQAEEVSLIAAGHIALGQALRQKGVYDAAQTHLRDGLEAAKTANDQKLIADIWLEFGNLTDRKGEYDLAFTQYEHALAIYHAIGHQQGEGAALGLMGLMAYVQMRYEESTQYMKQALRLAQEIGDRTGEGIVTGNLGLNKLVQGQYFAASEHFEQALAIAREVNHQWGAAMALNTLGLAYEGLEQYDKAIEYFKQSLNIALKIGNRWWEAMVLNHLGAMAIAQADYPKAKRYYQNAMTIHQALKQGHYLVEDWAGLGQVSLAAGDRILTRQYGEKILTYLRKHPHLVGAANIMRTFRFTWEIWAGINCPLEADEVLMMAIQIMKDYIKHHPDRVTKEVYLNQTHHHVLWQAWQAKKSR